MVASWTRPQTLSKVRAHVDIAGNTGADKLIARCTQPTWSSDLRGGWRRGKGPALADACARADAEWQGAASRGTLGGEKDEGTRARSCHRVQATKVWQTS